MGGMTRQIETDTLREWLDAREPVTVLDIRYQAAATLVVRAPKGVSMAPADPLYLSCTYIVPFWRIDAATPGRVDVEERRAREQPADRLLRRGKEFHAGDKPVDQADEPFAIGDVSGAIDQRVLAADEIGGHDGAEVAGVNGHSFPDFRRQLGRRPDGHCDRVVGGDRLAQHVATEGSGRAQDQEAGHLCPSTPSRPPA
jgi:hypothetical protein